MATQLQIINVALGRIGANDVSSLSNNSAEQKLAVIFWDVARQACLREHPWNFALKDAQLNRIDGYTSFEFKYAYQLPSDYIRLMQHYGNPTFKVQGRRILSNEEVCKIKYVADINDPLQWDASFTDLMSQRLAFDMGYALTKSQATADTMWSIYQQKLKLARHIDSTEDVQDMLGGPESNYIGVRD